jgi:hypothetical protein
MSWPVYEILLSISSAEPKFPSPNLYSVPPGIEITCSAFFQGDLLLRNNELALGNSPGLILHFYKQLIFQGEMKS